jgi:hypothetical protein
MIVEWLETLATPCPRPLRDMGYRRELVAIGARYRRCRAAWAEHLARSQRAVETAIARAPGRRTAVVIGSGRLLDVPLAALAAAFERVLLVDALHPLPTRFTAGRYGNVELVSADVTGTVDALHRLESGTPLPAPRPLALLQGDEVDFVVSMNIWSQIAVLPVEWIEQRLGPQAAAEAASFGAAVTRAHVEDLARCRAPVCLVADVEWRNVRPDGSIAEMGSSIHDLPVPPVVEEWIWPLAPAPENDPVLSEYRRVIVAYDPGNATPG